MTTSPELKVTARHLARTAFLYVRQSSLRQVLEHTESTARQYALRQRAIALGWPAEQIVVIDCDQGQSGASAVDRAGFQQLVAEVGLGHAGIVLGLEVSRLARSSTDWHRLLELCALSNTLILDEDGLYDPSQFNDRLLLGLKGTMSEAELHVLRARLIGGVLNKARRGELKLPLPIGLAYDPLDRVVLDPDLQVQHAVRLLFTTFQRTGSASATVRAFQNQELLFPRRLATGPRKGELVWGPLLFSHVLHTLHNPRYAGAFVYGRHQTRPTATGHEYRTLPREEWPVLIRDAHPGYITWEQYEDNLQRLLANAWAFGDDHRAGPPREGPALLQGLVICGRCGERMTVRYHHWRKRLLPDYVCMRERIQREQPVCQVIRGTAIDAAIGDLLVSSITPLSMETTLAIQSEVEAREVEADHLRRQHVERARQEAEVAQHRFMRVHPDNRMVADALEAEWNARLRELAEAQETYERQRAAAQQALDAEQRAAILNLVNDVPRLWRDPRTPARERKRLARLLMEDVTLLKTDHVTAHVRFKGGATHTLQLALPVPIGLLHKTDPIVVAEIDRLLEDHTDGKIAAILVERDVHTGGGVAFARLRVREVRLAYKLRSHYERLRARGYFTRHELAKLLGVGPETVKIWRRQGLLHGEAADDRGNYLYSPDQPKPRKHAWKFGRHAWRVTRARLIG
jgi:DNA invertase Pin-like site-specific DNA recombinase